MQDVTMSLENTSNILISQTGLESKQMIEVTGERLAEVNE